MLGVLLQDVGHFVDIVVERLFVLLMYLGSDLSGPLYQIGVSENLRYVGEALADIIDAVVEVLLQVGVVGYGDKPAVSDFLGLR